MPSYVFHGGALLDPRSADLLYGSEVLVEGERIREIATQRIDVPNATRVDLRGRTLMPGLIDAHVHIYLPEVNLARLEGTPVSLLTAKAVPILRSMLQRGFTTVRDVGGADWGIKEAVESGIIEGPRLFIAGCALTQTGGQADVRLRNDNRILGDSSTSALYRWSRVVDGVQDMTRAVREELRKGADHIKIMASGGILTQAGDPHTTQFTRGEIESACEIANNCGSYVAAHAYAPEAISLAVQSGVRSIEHGNYLNEHSADVIVQNHAFLVPTLAIFDALERRGGEYGMSEHSRRKNQSALEAGYRALETAQKAGVAVGFGTDLIGDLHEEQSREFLLRASVLSPSEIVRSATIVNARLLKRERELGEITVGGFADVLIVEGNPLRDATVLQHADTNIVAIMKGGRFYKNNLIA